MTALEKSSYLDPLEAKALALGETLAFRGLDEYVRDESAKFNRLIDVYCQHIEYIEAEEISPFEETLADLTLEVPDGIMVLAQSEARERVVRLSPMEIGLEELRFVEAQSKFANDVHRFVIAACGRRSGKTHIAVVRMVIRALTTDRADAWFVFAAPTHQQAKRIFWNRLLRMIPKQLVANVRYSDLSICLVNGAVLSVLGLDKPQRVEGRPLDGMLADEFADVKPEAWSENILPALSTTGRPGVADITGVPGGRNHYYRLVQSIRNPDEKNRERVERDWAFHHWTSRDVLTEDEIGALAASMDEISFDQEINASFVSVSGRVYYGFNDENQRELQYDPDKDLILAFDFNVSPGTANILQEGPDGTYCLGEVWIERDSNTEKVCDRIISDWQHHRGKVRCYGDASGGSRGTGRIHGNDWDIIRRRLSVIWPDLLIQVPNKNPEVRVRINALNTRIKRGDGIRQFFIDPRKCPKTVRDLEGVIWKDNDIDKSDQWLTHLTDGIGYYIASRFPLASASFMRVNV